MKQTQDNIQEWYRSNFALLEKSLNGESATRFHQIRTEALAAFGRLGFPSARDEEWKFTNVDPIARTPFQAVIERTDDGVGRKDIGPFLLEETDALRLVFLNGHVAQELSSVGKGPAGVRVESLARTLKTDPDSLLDLLGRQIPTDVNGFVALNSAFLRDGAFVRIPENVDVERPIHLLFLSSRFGEPFAVHPRIVVSVGRNSRVTIVESYASLEPSVHLTNAVVELFVADDAVVEHDKLQNESEQAFHIWTAHARLGAGSVLTSNAISLGGAIVRNTLTAELAGERAEATLNGLSLGTGRQLIDNHTVIDHAKPNCPSHELYKAILDGEARGVFNGKIFVRKDAQKTDAKQTNQTLILSDNATIDTKPQLEIFADDVKCTHGATVGQLDQEQVFYLTTRGIGQETARDILTYAFAADVVGRIHVDALRAQLEPLIHAKLDRGRKAREQA